jgi:hypothetical protein
MSMGNKITAHVLSGQAYCSQCDKPVQVGTHHDCPDGPSGKVLLSISSVQSTMEQFGSRCQQPMARTATM